MGVTLVTMKLHSIQDRSQDRTQARALEPPGTSFGFGKPTTWPARSLLPLPTAHRDWHRLRPRHWTEFSAQT